MKGIIRLTCSDEKVQIEGIFGESKEKAGKIKDVDIIAQEATSVAK
jgi:predicted RNA-binding protein